MDFLKRESSKDVWCNSCFKGVHQNDLLKMKDTNIKRKSPTGLMKRASQEIIFSRKEDKFALQRRQEGMHRLECPL